MKLTKMADGRILLEVAGRAHALSAFEIAQLADQLGVVTEPVEMGTVRALRTRVQELEDDRRPLIRRRARVVAETWERDLSDGNDQQITDDLSTALTNLLMAVAEIDR